MAALNEVFDAATVQRQAHASRMPRELGALLSKGVIGYQSGLRRRRHAVLGALLLTSTASLSVVADLSSPRLGGLRTDPSVHAWTAQGMGARSRRATAPAASAPG